MVSIAEGKINLDQVNFEKVFALVEGIDKNELDGLYSAIAELAETPQDVWNGMNEAFVRHCNKAVFGEELQDTGYDRFFARLLTILRRFCFKLTQQNLESVDILLLKAQYIDNCLQIISKDTKMKEVAEAKSQLQQLQVQRSSEVIQAGRQNWDITNFMNVAIVCILALFGAIALDTESLINYQLPSIHDWYADLLNYMNNNGDRTLSEFLTLVSLRLRF